MMKLEAACRSGASTSGAPADQPLVRPAASPSASPSTSPATSTSASASAAAPTASAAAALAATLSATLSAVAGRAPADGLQGLIDGGWDRLPRLPFPAGGNGATLARWRVLAAVGACDLALAKLFEGHTDALAILHEAGMAAAPGAWGTWCAEPPDARLRLLRAGGDAAAAAAGVDPAAPATPATPAAPAAPAATAAPAAASMLDGAAGVAVLLDGRKAWCSGARSLSHALVSCWDQAGQPMLAAVDLRQRGVAFDEHGWCAVGMAGSDSIDVLFDRVPAIAVGAPGFYVARSGFWHGGAGVAACWHGAAGALAEALVTAFGLHGGADAAALPPQAVARPPDPHRLAQLGQVAVALQGAAATMREAAAAIDAAPGADAMTTALTVRLAVEAAATATLAAVGRALGAGPLCRDAATARRFADLPVFLRQSHAERDQAALGQALLAAGATDRTAAAPASGPAPAAVAVPAIAIASDAAPAPGASGALRQAPARHPAPWNL